MRQRRMNFGVRFTYDTKGDGFALFTTVSDAFDFAAQVDLATEVINLKSREVIRSFQGGDSPGVMEWLRVIEYLRDNEGLFPELRTRDVDPEDEK